jgi:PncC family amidohydrolase
VVDARPPSDAELMETASQLGARLRERGLRMVTAESSTGGLLGHVVTQVPGASDYYLGGVVTYADWMKATMLGIDPDLLQRVGAVSAEVAAAMASGILTRTPSDLAAAVTGIAGPDGGSAAKPVGLTYVAVQRARRPVHIERRAWPSDRDGNKRATAGLALEMLLAETG